MDQPAPHVISAPHAIGGAGSPRSFDRWGRAGVIAPDGIRWTLWRSPLPWRPRVLPSALAAAQECLGGEFDDQFEDPILSLRIPPRHEDLQAARAAWRVVRVVVVVAQAVLAVALGVLEGLTLLLALVPVGLIRSLWRGARGGTVAIHLYRNGTYAWTERVDPAGGAEALLDRARAGRVAEDDLDPAVLLLRPR